MPIVIVGNKCELSERFLPIEITEAIAKYDWECGYVECSAKNNTNIIQVFKELLTQAKVNSKQTRTIYYVPDVNLNTIRMTNKLKWNELK